MCLLNSVRNGKCLSNIWSDSLASTPDYPLAAWFRKHIRGTPSDFLHAVSCISACALVIYNNIIYLKNLVIFTILSCYSLFIILPWVSYVFYVKNLGIFTIQLLKYQPSQHIGMSTLHVQKCEWLEATKKIVPDPEIKTGINIYECYNSFQLILRICSSCRMLLYGTISTIQPSKLVYK